MVLPENTEELCSSVKYGRTMFFRKIFAKLFRKKKKLVLPYFTEEPCSSVEFLKVEQTHYKRCVNQLGFSCARVAMIRLITPERLK